MKLTKILTLGLVFSTLFGCAGSPPSIDVSDSIYRGTGPTNSPAHRVSSLTIKNKADNGKFINPLFSDTIFPIETKVPSRTTVEQDIERYLNDNLKTDPLANRSIHVTISKADTYWVYGGAQKIPFVGLAFVAADKEFGMNLKVNIEIEESGKVVSTYTYDEKISIQGKATTPEAVAESYKKLISEYRQRFFGELDDRFINRYF